MPKHLKDHNLDGWSVNALRTVLMEEGAELTVSLACCCVMDGGGVLIGFVGEEVDGFRY